MTDPIVKADWLAKNLDRVHVLDATYYLPADPTRSRLEFETVRIPGARLYEIDEVCDTQSDLPHMLPDAATFARAMANLGIDGRKPVVVYDRSANHFSAPRVWFTLRVFGIMESFVLDGGLNIWKRSGHPVSSGACEATTVPERSWVLDKSRVVSGADMAALVAARCETVLDARAQDRFDGKAPEPRPGLKSGHMPGAHCIPFTTLTDGDGRFLDAVRLRQRFGDTAAASIVTCGSGMTACVLALGLERIDSHARLYDGSWAEWGKGELGPINSLV